MDSSIPVWIFTTACVGRRFENGISDTNSAIRVHFDKPIIFRQTSLKIDKIHAFMIFAQLRQNEGVTWTKVMLRRPREFGGTNPPAK